MEYRPTVAIVGGTPEMQDDLAQLLEDGGFDAELFASVEAYSYRAARSEAACVLLDIPLGDTSGIDWVRRLHINGRALPTVFLVESAEETMRLKTKRLDHATFVRKRSLPEQLIAAVRALR